MSDSDSGAVLITGGAGYIGSHAVLAFKAAGYDVVVLDDLSTGRRDLVPDDVPFVLADVGDREKVHSLIREHRVAAVIHFAGSIVVPESVVDPLKYYRNNTSKSRDLIEACVDGDVRYFVFSSTAAIYGNPLKIPIGEDTPAQPINPYGRSKLMTEWVLEDAAAAHGLHYAALRYFNVAGADPEGRTGQISPKATHLIKIASEAVVGLRDQVQIFGEDYDTPDGTCVRDYIHVADLAAAHVDVLRHLRSGGENLVLNCGYGRGYSVRQVLDAVQNETGDRLDVRGVPRRPGDPPILVSDPSRIAARLGWRPRYGDLGLIIRTAVDWERKLAALG